MVRGLPVPWLAASSARSRSRIKEHVILVVVVSWWSAQWTLAGSVAKDTDALPGARQAVSLKGGEPTALKNAVVPSALEGLLRGRGSVG